MTKLSTTKLLLLVLLISVSFLSTSGQKVVTKHAKTTSHPITLNGEDNSTDDHDGDGIDDHKEKAYERQLEVEYEDNKFKAKSVLKNDSNKDEFEVEFNVESDSSAELSFKYATESSSGQSDLSYRVKFDQILEFNDTGPVGMDNETALQTYDIGKTGWQALQTDYNQTSGFVKVNATTADGVFSLVMKLTSSFLVNDNVTLSPNSLKIDVHVNNFNYVGNDTKLALKSYIKTGSEVSLEHQSEDEKEGFAANETQVGIGNANATGYYSWSEQVSMDSQTAAVVTSNVKDSTAEEGESSSKIYFTFNSTSQAKNILWDPKLGVVSRGAQTNLQGGISSQSTSVSSSATGSVTSSVTTTSSSTTDSVVHTTADAKPTEKSSAPVALLSILTSIIAIPLLRRRR